jgi:ABC-type transporter Mla maintaining outer membrane lipid asymmetry ATPase subunit MlaF
MYVAGKTTAVHCLIGLQTPTNGGASLYGMDIINDRARIHKLMGVCPQFDILWDELTVWYYNCTLVIAHADALPYVHVCLFVCVCVCVARAAPNRQWNT